MHKLVSGSNMTSNSALNLMKLVDSPALTIKSGHEHVPYKPIYIYYDPKINSNINHHLHQFTLNQKSMSQNML